MLEKDSLVRNNIFWYLIVLSKIRKLHTIVEQKIDAMSNLLTSALGHPKFKIQIDLQDTFAHH